MSGMVRGIRLARKCAAEWHLKKDHMFTSCRGLAFEAVLAVTPSYDMRKTLNLGSILLHCIN